MNLKRPLFITVISVSLLCLLMLANRDPNLIPIKNLPLIWAHSSVSIRHWLALFSKMDKPVKADSPEFGEPQQQNSQNKAQAQLIGAMESIVNSAPSFDADTLPNEIGHYRQAYKEAETVADKRAALVALTALDKHGALPLLQQAYQDKDSELRLEVITQIRAHQLQRNALQIVLTALNDPAPDVVMEAVEASANIKDKKIISALAKIAQQHPDPLIRAVAADYVAQSDP